MENKAKTLNVGGLFKSSKDGSLYIKFDKPVKVTNYKGDTVETLYINLETPESELERLVKYNVITEDVAEQRLAKAKEINKKYNVTARFKQ